ncbi:hypothetical protein F53441_13313 [Fusarium austroafricanum]|uniref:Uncharacterized protein n=1 Tax=Fusarium austroafricanum TaxID=2364996 RepID=A0A8H4NFU8_9HYPO|nr:hypothetical protein F53441_13313 [Fusarium austroafricanum]
MPHPKHLYPGVNLALRDMPDMYSNSTVVPVKEVAMMILMDTLTDKPDWHKKAFDETIVQKWRNEALSMSEDGMYARILQDKLEGGPPMPGSRIVTEAAFDYCIEEMRVKANYFLKSGLIPTLDGPGNTIIKSDSHIDEALHQDLNNACDQLREDQKDKIDWHPRSNDMVQDLIHPSMYHFVYDRSPFIQEEVVGVSNALDFIGQGEPIDGQTPLKVPFDSYGYNIGSGRVQPEYWSEKYQWLPANVAFQGDGSAKFTSYVNNLHPTKFADVYKTLETLVDKVIPAWDHCLREYRSYRDKVNAGREKSRFAWIHVANDEDDENWLPKWDLEEFKNKDVELTNEELEELEENCCDCAENPIEVDEDEATRRFNENLSPLTPNVDEESLARAKWEKFRSAKLPDPLPFEAADYAPKETLHEKFKEHGLQIIVKMASIELTPKKPEFPAGGWHIEGQMNEKIAATALYYFDSENVTDARLAFRTQTSYYLNDDLETNQDQFKYAEAVYGTLLRGGSAWPASACTQGYGDIETREGRLLAFPNVFQHRVSSFRLQDPTKPGHRRFIALWLVDPHQRILSTANVPPQQKDWWIGDGEVPKGLMSVEESREHRLKLMDERTAERAQSHWHSVNYNFCEH